MAKTITSTSTWTADGISNACRDTGLTAAMAGRIISNLPRSARAYTWAQINVALMRCGFKAHEIVQMLASFAAEQV